MNLTVYKTYVQTKYHKVRRSSAPSTPSWIFKFPPQRVLVAALRGRAAGKTAAWPRHLPPRGYFLANCPYIFRFLVLLTSVTFLIYLGTFPLFFVFFVVVEEDIMGDRERDTKKSTYCVTWGRGKHFSKNDFINLVLT